jgi:hypothetical protein
MAPLVPTRPVAEPSAICLTCRTALARGETCDIGEHHWTADLTTESGRKALLTEVWGPRSQRRRLEEIVRAEKTGSGFADHGVLGAIALIVLVIVDVAALLILGAFVADARRRCSLLRPYGAIVQPSPYELNRGQAGVVEGAPLPSPLRRDTCLAFGVVLRSSRPATGSGGLLWQEMATTGMRIRLDDGSLVHVPAGRIRLSPNRARARKAAADEARARLPGPLGVVVPGELPYLPFDEAHEVVIRPGDRVVLLSPTELREDPTAERPSLREPARTVLVATGTPVLRLDAARAT